MRFTAAEPKSLLEFLSDKNPDCSKNTLRSWLEKGRVCVDGKRVHKAGTTLIPGQEVTVGPRTEFMRGDVEILYEDKYLVVVNKPEGLLSVDTDFDATHSLHTLLKRRRQRVFPVHRLDRETSGILVFAYEEKTRDHLKTLFEKHTIEREYHAVVEGAPTPPQGKWESYLEEGPDLYVNETNAERGRHAITHYTTVQTSSRFSLLRLKLETGRKNQIRVHCKSAKCPIVGDVKYGAAKHMRLFLHASKLSFHHSSLEKEMKFEIPLPELFYKILK